MLKPVLHQFSGASWGERVSLSLDGCYSWTLSLTEKGVRLFSGPGNNAYFSRLDGVSGKPRVYRGSMADFPDYPVVSSVVYKDVTINLESNGNVFVITSGSSFKDKNWLLMLTPDGIFRYRFIVGSLLSELGWPHDSERRLQILRG